MEAEKEQSAVKSTKSSVKVKLERHKRRAHFFPLRRFRHSFKTSALNRTGDGKRRSFSGYFSLYRYATPCDICMMLFSGCVAFVSGGCIPIMAREFGRLVNSMILSNAFATSQTEGNTSCPGSLIESDFGLKKPEEFIERFVSVFAPTSGAYVVFNAVYFASWYISAEKQNKIWAKAYFKGLVEKDLEWFDTHGSHDYPSESMENLFLIRQGIGVQIPFGISLVSTCCFSIVCILWDGYPTVLFSLSAMAIIPIIFAIQLLIATFAAKEAIAWTREVVPLIAFAQEVIRGIQAVMLYNGQRTELERFKNEQKYLLKGSRHEAVVYSLLTGMLSFSATAYSALILWHGLTITWDHRGCRRGEDITDSFNTETMFTTFACVAVGMVDAWLIFPILEACGLAEESGIRVSCTIDSKSATKSFGSEGAIPTNFQGKVEFEDVRFAFPNNKDFMVLNNLSFTVEPGWKVGLVGLKGVEFSAVFTLLLRHYLPDGGFIRLDDEDIRNLNRSWYVGMIGYLSNDPMLFHETIEHNIRKANPDATQAEIEQACMLAQVHQSILELPEGYQTYVGEDGNLLPPMMRLQVALARTLIQKPKILIFEEPTADLDWHCAAIMMDILDRASKGKTTLWIPHHLRCMIGADMIFVIEKGQVIEQGTYSELMNGKGIFYRLANKMLVVSGKGRKWEPIKPGVLHHDKSFFLPPQRFALSVYNTGLGACPDPVEVKVGQAWISNKYTSVLAKQRYQENPPGYYETLYETIMTEEDDMSFNGVTDMDPDWKRCSARDDKYYTERPLHEDPTRARDQVLFSWCTILREATPAPTAICIGAFCCIILGAVTPTYGLLLGKIVEVFSEPKKSEALEFGQQLTILMVVLAVILGLMKFVRTLALGIASLKSFRKVQKKLFTCIIRQERTWFERPENSSEALTVRLSRDVGAVTYIIKYLFKTVLEDGIGIISCIVVAGFADERLFQWNLFLPPLSILMASMDGFAVCYFEQARHDKMKRRIRNVTLDLFNNRQTVSALHLEHYFLNRLEFILDTYHHKLRCFPYIRGLTFTLCQGGAFVLYGIYMALVARRMKTENVDFSSALIIGHVFIFEMWRIGVGFSAMPNLRKAFIRVANVLKITRRQPQIPLDAGFAKDIKGCIAFHDVYFWRENCPDRQILNGATFKIDAKKTVALVGTAGSGKTICHQLIMRFQDVTQGRVELDGSDTRDINCLQLRKQVGILDQDPLLFERTVRENIAYGDTSRSVPLNEVVEAAMQANIHRFISSLPRGYETVIGPTNTILTHSQKQRICMARIFIKNPKILLIEEPLTSSDGETERKLQNSEAKMKQGRTCIIIAHRIRTTETADQIIVFHDGAVKESGTFKQLMNMKNGLYKQIYEAQREGKEFFEAVNIRKPSDSSSTNSDHRDGIVATVVTPPPLPPSEPVAQTVEEIIIEPEPFTYTDLAEHIIAGLPRVFKL